MEVLKYVANYPSHIVTQIEGLIADDKLTNYLLKKYPEKHTISNEKLLYEYAQDYTRYQSKCFIQS